MEPIKPTVPKDYGSVDVDKVPQDSFSLGTQPTDYATVEPLRHHKVSRGEFLTYGLGTLLALTGIGGIINPKRTTLT